MRRKKDEKKPEKVGGLVFYLSLFFLIFLDCVFIFLLTPTVFSGKDLHTNWFFFLLGGLTGWFVASGLISGRLAVFFHELNHKVLSGLVGNKPKKLKVGKDEGFFEYEYTKDTAAYNAFIALAPYFFPLFTFFALALSLIGWRSRHELAVCITGMGYGCDLFMNTRSVSPHQSDFQQIRGGYKAGFLYVIAATLAIFFILAAWVSDGASGIIATGRTLFEIAVVAVEWFTGVEIKGI